MMKEKGKGNLIRRRGIRASYMFCSAVHFTSLVCPSLVLGTVSSVLPHLDTFTNLSLSGEGDNLSIIVTRVIYRKKIGEMSSHLWRHGMELRKRSETRNTRVRISYKDEPITQTLVCCTSPSSMLQ